MKNILLFPFAYLILGCNSDHYSDIHIWMEKQAHMQGDSLIVIKKENVETINDYMKTYYYTAEFKKADKKVVEKTDSQRIFTTGGNTIITIQKFLK